MPKTIWKENIGLVSHEQFSFSNIAENKNIKKINTDKYANILIRFFKFVKFQKAKKKLIGKKLLVNTKVNTQTNMKNSYANMLKKKPIIMKNNNIQPTEKKIISLFVNKIIKSTGKFSTVNWISGSCLSQIDDKTIRMKKYIDISGGIVTFFLRNSDFFTLYKYDKSKSKNLSWETKLSNPFDNLMVYLEGKETGIKNGSIVIPEKKVKISDKRIEKRLPEIQLSEFLPGWNSNSDFNVVNTSQLRFDNLHPFVQMIHCAFAEHYKISLIPDSIWPVIAQNFSLHINENSEKYRYVFVNHEGKKKISIIRNGFVKEFEKNDWSSVFPEFAEKITDIIGKKNSTLVLEHFSTTGRSDFMSYQVVLMDMVKEYFEYIVHTRCGIPEFNIKGSVDDWNKMRIKIQRFREFDLDDWVNNLEYFIDNMIKIVNGDDNKSFLNSFYKFESTSGSEWITGEILRLFPYQRITKYDEQNNKSFKFVRFDYDVNKSNWSGKVSGISTDSFPSGVTSVPFIWDYHGNQINMRFNTEGVIVVDGDTLEMKNNVNVCLE